MALFLSLLAIFLTLAAALSLAVRGISRRAAERLSARTSAVCVVAPILISAGFCAALVVPGWVRGACHCVEHGLHHLHLCLLHPEYAANACAPAAAAVALWATLALPRLGRLVVDVSRTSLWARGIARVEAQTVDGVRFHLVDAPGLGACTTGSWRPLIVVDRQLEGALDDEQLRAVLHHEDGHRRRLDPLTLIALRVCCAVSSSPESALLKRWQGRAEAECDRHAAERLGAPEPVAAALLELERLRSTGSHGVRAAATGGNLADRVRALLDPKGFCAPANLRNDLVHALVVAMLVTLVLVLPSADSLHHAAETLLGHLLHH